MSKTVFKKVMLASLVVGLMASVSGCLPTTKSPGAANTPAASTPARAAQASATPAK